MNGGFSLTSLLGYGEMLGLSKKEAIAFALLVDAALRNDEVDFANTYDAMMGKALSLAEAQNVHNRVSEFLGDQVRANLFDMGRPKPEEEDVLDQFDAMESYGEASLAIGQPGGSASLTIGITPGNYSGQPASFTTQTDLAGNPFGAGFDPGVIGITGAINGPVGSIVGRNENNQLITVSNLSGRLGVQGRWSGNAYNDFAPPAPPAPPQVPDNPQGPEPGEIDT
jgi:hypothetical protein